MRFLSSLLILIVCSVLNTSAQAATFTVTSTADTDGSTCGTTCTLRQAINATNNAAGDDAIVFDADVFGSSKQTIALSGTALPEIRGVLTITGPSASGAGVTLDAGGKSRIFSPQYSLTLSFLTFMGGYADYGGVIANFGTGAITVSNSTFSDNSVAYRGGAIYSVSGGTLTVSNSTFAGNVAPDEVGGAIFFNSGALTVSNSTFSDNFAPEGQGTAIANYGTLTVSNSIVLSKDQQAISNRGFLVSGGYNLISNGVVGGNFMASDQTRVTSNQVKLAPLASNGGPTQTRALLPGSIAINAGNPKFDSSTTPTDQRGSGYMRVRDGRIDIGAFELQDDAPVVASVNITPIDPQTNSILTATAHASDAQNDVLTYTYVWKNGSRVVQSGPSNTLDLSVAGRGAKGDLITVTVTAGDGSLKGAPVTSGSVTVLNSAPRVASASVKPASPTTSSVLTATADESDADKEALVFSYQWQKNGMPLQGATHKTLALSKAGNGDKGDVLTCTVTVSDGTSSAAATSAPVIVGNSAPRFPDPRITPLSRMTNDVISAPLATDADGDTLSYSYQWQKNGENLVGQVGSSLDLGVDGNGDKGDLISVMVTANDGTTSTTITSPLARVGNTSPVVASATITPASPTTNTLLTATAQESDVDHEQLYFSYQWQKNGVPIQGANRKTLDLSKAGNGNKGDQITCTITVGDDRATAFATSSPVTIGNSVPKVNALSLAPTSPSPTSQVTATSQVFDADASDGVDTLTYNFSWSLGSRALSEEKGATLDLSKYAFVKTGDILTLQLRLSDGSSLSAARSASVKVGKSTKVPASPLPSSPTPSYSAGNS